MPYFHHSPIPAPLYDADKAYPDQIQIQDLKLSVKNECSDQKVDVSIAYWLDYNDLSIHCDAYYNNLVLLA